MFVYTPVRLLLIAAVLPGLFLAWKINKMDRYEREPFGLLVKCFFFGALSIIPALILEGLGIRILGAVFYSSSLLFEVLLYFGVIACSEELSKYFFLKRATWYNPEFNYRFDAVVYAVFVGIGFAVFENISYVMNYGLLTAVIRAVTAVPAHTIFAIFMGHYYGQAKQYNRAGDPVRENLYKKAACVLPILLHGFYDFAASADNGMMTGVFWIFLILLYGISYRRLKKDAGNDAPL